METNNKLITLAQQNYINAIVDYLDITHPQLETVTDGKTWLTNIFTKYPTLQQDMKVHKEQLRSQKEDERNRALYQQFINGNTIEILASKYALPETVVKNIIQKQL